MKYSFKFTLFGKKVQMFNDGDMGIVIEKESQVVCVYGTSRDHNDILCAIPLCHPRYLKNVEYTVEFCSEKCAKITAGDIRIIIDFANKKCANNKGIQSYGSDSWGNEVSVAWDESRF